MNNQNLIFTIDGNIGSGKSTVISFLKEHYKNSKKIIFLEEPVNVWISIKDSNNKNIIENFYENKDKYSFSFQMLCYITRLKNISDTINSNTNCIIISERSIYTDKLVFAKMLYDSNFINSLDYQIYLYFFDFFVNFKINNLFYLKTSSQFCLDRIKKRSRSGEETISLDYLISCNSYHENMITDTFFENLVIIDGNNNIENVASSFISIINNYL